MKNIRGTLFMILTLTASLTGAAIAISGAATADSTPFWAGTPDAAGFAKMSGGQLAAARAAIEGMLAVKDKRTVENTLRPYDEAMLQLDMAGSQSNLMENVHPDSIMRTTAEKLTQDVSSYANELSLDRRIYDALKAVDLSKADPETRFYVERELRDFRLAGVDRDEPTRKKIRELRDELVKIGQEFDRNIRSDVRTIQVASAADLDGLPADYIANHKPGTDGRITLNINYPDYVPVMTYAKNDDVRKRLYMEFQNRAYPQNEEVLRRMIEKRYALAQLVGYGSWADYITANKMSGSAKNVREFIDKIVAASAGSAERDYKVLLQRKQQDDAAATAVNFWEYGYYGEMVKRSGYNFDSQAMRPYLAYDQVKQGVLDLTSKLFGVSFKRIENAPVWHPSVECYEMSENGRLIGRFYLDMHPRPNKYNHAACFGISTGVEGRQVPQAALICNLPGGEPGDPGLCQIEDVNTFFHEFGHLIHSLFGGHHQWCGVGGIRTEHDFVEAPSQMLEEWMRDPKTLQTFAKHYQTGEPVPAEMVLQMKRANDFAKGLNVRRQMVYADLSLSIYDRDPARVDVNQTMQALVKSYQPFPFVEGTHFHCAFGHLDQYSAVYYTYMWSLVIAKDLFSKFDKTNLLDAKIAMRYRDAILTPGGSKPAAQLVKDFLGRPFDFGAYQMWLNEAN